jgi:RNA polymerase sigma-54 factor
MSLELSLNISQQQQLTMTPRLQQSIKMLQMTVQELTTLVDKELLENPTLELEDIDQEQKKVDENIESYNEADSGASESEKSDSSLEALENETNVNWEEYFDSTELGSRTTGAVTSTGEQIDYENMVTEETTLQDHLLLQLKINTFNEEDYKIGEFLIGNIDRSGFLKISAEDAARWLNHSEEDILEVLQLIQNFDPNGVGARNLAECLLNQYQLSDDYHPDDLIEKVLRHHLDDLSNKNFKEIARQLSVSPSEIQDVLDYITDNLEPRPGMNFPSAYGNQYIKPDVYVEKEEDGYKVTMNDSGIPRLIISPQYREMLRSRLDSNKTERKFIRGKLDAAQWLIKSIEQRRETIFKVASSIVTFQEEFLDMGISRFKPLTLKDVALDIDMHESTVSRVTTGKYMQTPRGVFEFKFFFSSGLSKDGCEDVSSMAVKARIKTLIENENIHKPLSDQKIVEILESDGTQIARRTVAKYREELNIASSSKRKRLK